jgi:eukaryotic-like serine/threonine-protein kinase
MYGPPRTYGDPLSIACPYCDHKLNLRFPKPGRFRPNCPSCSKPFILIVPRDGARVKVSAVAAATSLANREDETPPPGGPLVVEATPVPAGSEQIIVEAASRFASNGKPHSGVPTDTHPKDDESPSARLDIRGYAIERELGRGGMGTVFLARQLSLDRHVALKVMSRRWATDPIFVARFTREAYAAAQLSHPNIIQIYDIGEVEGTRFFSMEYVPGRTLAEIVKNDGKLDPETAIGYVLQAARGLKHAHDRGMIHRDVKPDNLILDEQGLVKVGDLGLVKTPATSRADDAADGPRGLASLPIDVTGARIALGTPAYMSPEQCRDAATVDHRADIYSLGCTLYVLVTGRQPFDGTTAVELMTKHAYEPLVPPEYIVARMPKEVSEIIQRMMAKSADDRFQTMGEVIRTLEGWLGIQRAGRFSPREEQISRLEDFVAEYNRAPTALLRRHIFTGFFASLALATVLIAFFGNLVWAFGLIGLVVQTALAYFVLDGLARHGHLFTRTRQFVFGLTWGDWIIGTASLALFVILLVLLNVVWVWTGFGLIGIGLAFALRYGIDRQAEEEQRIPVEGCERFLRRLRAQGIDEEEIHHFVAKYAGRDWEGFFEALFGFDAKLTARAVLLRGGAGGARNKHAAWREPIIAAMDRIEKSRRAARARQLLQAVERAHLVAAGQAPEVADGKAKAAAEAMVRAADDVHATEQRRARVTAVCIGMPAPVNVREAVVGAEEHALAGVPQREPSGGFVNLFVGSHVRAAVAALLLAGCALWVCQNTLVPAAEVTGPGQQAVESATLRKSSGALVIAGVPREATSWIDGWNVGAAGLLLLASLFCRGNVMSVFALLGAAVVAVGHQHGIRTVEPFRSEHVALMLGFVLALVGFRAAR